MRRGPPARSRRLSATTRGSSAPSCGGAGLQARLAQGAVHHPGPHPLPATVRPSGERGGADNDGIALGYGLGWGVLRSPHGVGAFKEGHSDDGFEHYSIVFPERGIGVLLMSNSANGESIFKELLELTIADTYTPWVWQGYEP